MGLIGVMKKNKAMTVAVLLLLVIFLAVFGTRLWFFAKFLLGNDVLIQLTPSQSYFSLPNSHEAQVDLKITVTANPFCEARCASKFSDISANRTLATENFTLKGERSVTKSYTIKAYRLGEGQDVYEFEIECHGAKSLLCYTTSELKERSVLITVEHTLNSSELMLKGTSNASFAEIRSRIARLEGKAQSANATIENFRNNLNFSASDDVASLIVAVAEQHMRLLGLRTTWDEQDYYLLDREIDFVKNAVSETEGESAALDAEISGNITQYNLLVDDLNSTKELLVHLDSPENVYIMSQLNTTGENFREALAIFNSTKILAEKKIAAAKIANETMELAKAAEDTLRNRTLERETGNLVLSDSLCRITGICLQHKTPYEMANETNFSLQVACLDTEILRNAYNTTPGTGNETGNATLKAEWVLQKTASGIVLPDNGTNSGIIGRALNTYRFNVSEMDYNATRQILQELKVMLPEKCPEYAPLNSSYAIPEKISPVEENVPEAAVFLEEQPQKCCISGSCPSCCEGCGTKNYPLIFLHGHTFSKDTSAEYTLDAFSGMQEKLEPDIYLDAGTLTLDSQAGIPGGVWGREPLPISIKASYYFDIFSNQQIYTTVQANSESIETYAIRLKDIIDEAKRRTGKQNVTIVAHSMGGLVARRYIQLFDRHDVDKLILLAVPNNGIDANTAQYCSFFGESLECKDMNSQSLFINKLKNGKMPDIPITNVIGSGCLTRGKMGDGILTVEDAWLEGASNIIINGTCGQISKLHGNIVNVDMYPEVYRIVLDALTK